jgi:uncharacterized protein
MDKKMIHMLTFSLAMVGALNWGLVGLLDFNLVETLVGTWPVVEKLAYAGVGLSAVYVLITHMDDCRMCSGKKK